MDLDKVVDALTDCPSGPSGYVDFFAPTWQCSHVRFCRGLWDANDYSREHALAWILRRDEEDYKTNWRKSVFASSCIPISLKEISAAIKTSKGEIERSENLGNPSRLPLIDSDLSDATMPQRIEGLALYDYGPTAVYTWQREAEFNYLELHYES